MRRRKSMVRTVTGMILLFGLVFSLLPAGLAFGQAGAGRVSEAEAVIASKGEDRVFIWETPYRVSGQTLIFAPDGTRLRLFSLAVPCRARVKFYEPQEGQGPLLTEIQVLEYLSGSVVRPPEPE